MFRCVVFQIVELRFRLRRITNTEDEFERRMLVKQQLLDDFEALRQMIERYTG